MSTHWKPEIFFFNQYTEIFVFRCQKKLAHFKSKISWAAHQSSCEQTFVKTLRSRSSKQGESETLALLFLWLLQRWTLDRTADTWLRTNGVDHPVLSEPYKIYGAHRMACVGTWKQAVLLPSIMRKFPNLINSLRDASIRERERRRRIKQADGAWAKSIGSDQVNVGSVAHSR